MNSCSPEVAEPLDELGGVVLVELDVWKIIFENRRARIANVKEHELRLAQMHRSQCTGVYIVTVKSSLYVVYITKHSNILYYTPF